MKESYLEHSCCIYARSRWCHPIKLSDGITGVPDRMFLLPEGRCWLVEFKVPGGTLTPRQKLVHAQLAAIGHDVSVIYTTKQFKAQLDDRLVPL